MPAAPMWTSRSRCCRTRIWSGPRCCRCRSNPADHQIGNANATLSILPGRAGDQRQRSRAIRFPKWRLCRGIHDHPERRTEQRVHGQSDVGGTATAGTDYVALPASVQFTTNQTSTNIFVSVLNANLTMAKTVLVSLVPSSSYFPGLTTNATVTLVL